ncbi:hypothetical protein F5148DRAFT_1280243 [Russula earlei]|uniref:Uncharacterized protein n=1 Tax=Russula earlei TaxID=71964 RepID=A0ACC0UKJ8_9AGAM|nr:hypothetical protein F5148DRAFT_1280243 [Russula earlei]
MEHVVPATTISPSTSQHVAAILLTSPQLRSHLLAGFFVIEAKISDPSDHVPLAVCEMYACGKLLQKKVLRGTLTNGRQWIFLLRVVKLNDDYDRASYKPSSMVQLTTSGGQPVF